MKRTLLLLVSLIITVGVWADGLVYTPTLKAPLSGAEFQVPNATVSWNAITGSLNLQYQVQVDTTPLFNSSFKLDTVQTLLCGYTTHELIFGGKYYWRVRAIDNGQTSAWSVVWNFYVFNAPVLSTPSNSAGDQAPNVSLVWKDVVTALSATKLTGFRYWDYQIDSSANFNSPLLTGGTTTPKVLKATTTGLLFGVTYYWRVRARHNLSTSAWCEPFKFSVTNTVTLQTPNDNATAQNLDVILRWKNVTGLLGYQYEVATDPDFTQLIIMGEKDTNFVKASLLMFGTKYYWRVRARHQYDTTLWSPARNFTTASTVALKTPADAEQNVALKPVMTWTAITLIEGYQLQIDSINTFPAPFIDVKPVAKDVSYTVNKKLKPQTTYYWRMRAFSDGGVTADTTDWSPVRSFVTTSSTGLDETTSSGMAIYPNPASDKVYVRIDLNESLTAQLTLVDLLGKTVLSHELSLNAGQNLKEVRLDGVNKGVYILRLTMKGQTTNQKLIVER